MTARLIGTPKPSITYNRGLGKYRDGATGRFVSRSSILRLVDEEAARLSARMQGHARLLTQNKIDLPTFQRRSAEDLKLSFLRSALLGSGSKSLATNQTYGSVGRLLRSQYEYLDGFARDLAAGKLTAKQAIARAASYGASTKTAFHESEKIARGREGFVEAKRSLDSAAQHCFSCLSYSTNGLWVPLEQIVMPGVRCECFHFCRCQVIFRKRS